MPVRMALPALGLLVGMAGLASSLEFDVAAAKNRPVSKVITLLKDMSKTLEKEAAEDEELYENMACWCTTNDKEKTTAIADAEAKIDRLNNKIEELTALSARLNAEIENLEKEKAANEAALASATALREKQLSEFNAEEKDLLESIAALKGALEVLGSHQSLLQMPSSHAASVAATLQREMTKHAVLLEGVLTHKERRAISAFVQAPKDYFDAAPTFKQSYAPQSGEIYGVLSQMKETFESNLSAAQKEEMASQQAYEELKAAKEAQIAAAAEAINKKTVELADTDEKNSAAKQELEDTKASLSADQQYLMMLKEKCAMTDKEMQERRTTRQAEMGAVSKALAVLSGDDAHDLFSRTFNPASFVQKESITHSKRRERAAQILSAAARKFHKPQLSTLAYQVKLDAFTRVKKSIDDMISMLLQEKADEIKHKDFCTDELNTNQLQTEKKERLKMDLIAKIEDLTAKIKMLTETIETLKAEIGDLQLSLKRVGEDREKQNREFQVTVQDQRETQKLLQSALTILNDFYKASAAALVQKGKQEPVGPPPPPGFKAYTKNAASGGVTAMITQIIEDAAAMEKDVLKAEDDAQKAYEMFVTETNKSIEAKAKEIVHLSSEKAKTEEELVETEEAKATTETELEQLSTYNSELHTSCDYILKNFDVRQTARDEEVEALKQAKAILSGAKFELFLQGK